jgi:hypothetical protein
MTTQQTVAVLLLALAAVLAIVAAAVPAARGVLVALALAAGFAGLAVEAAA